MRKDAASIGELDQHHQFLNDNEFIRRGYRLNFYSIGRIFRSLFMCHNESMNVWSHLLGAVLFLGLLWYAISFMGFSPNIHTQEIYETLANSTYMNDMKSAIDSLALAEEKVEEKVRELAEAICPNIDGMMAEVESLLPEKSLVAFGELRAYFENRMVHFCQQMEAQFDSETFNFLFEVYNPYKALMHPSLLADTHVARCKLHLGPIMVFVISASFCLGCSATFHLFSAYSRTINVFMSRLDYAGISLLIAGSFYPVGYYFFYCHEGKDYPELIWLYLTSITLCALFVFSVSLSERFQMKQYRTYRGLLFAGLGCLGVIPGIHASILHWPLVLLFLKPAYFVFIMGALYLIGVGIFIARFPEKYFPGRFDLLGHSHNIWHFFVLAAAISHYFGSLGFYHTREWLTCSG